MYRIKYCGPDNWSLEKDEKVGYFRRAWVIKQYGTKEELIILMNKLKYDSKGQETLYFEDDGSEYVESRGRK